MRRVSFKHWDKTSVVFSVRVSNLSRVRHRLAAVGFINVNPNVFIREETICYVKPENNYVYTKTPEDDFHVMYRILSK